MQLLCETLPIYISWYYHYQNRRNSAYDKKFKTNNTCNKRKQCPLDTFGMQGRVRVSDTRYLQAAKRFILKYYLKKHYNTAYTTYTIRTENRLISIWYQILLLRCIYTYIILCKSYVRIVDFKRRRYIIDPRPAGTSDRSTTGWEKAERKKKPSLYRSTASLHAAFRSENRCPSSTKLRGWPRWKSTV